MKKFALFFAFATTLFYLGCKKDPVTGVVLNTVDSLLLDSLKADSIKKLLNLDLVAYYPFNGNANDETGNNNDGIVFGAKLSNDRLSVLNQCYYFDGNSYIKLPSDSFKNNNYSFSFWAYFDEIPEYGNMGALISFGNSDGDQIIAINNHYGTATGLLDAGSYDTEGNEPVVYSDKDYSETKKWVHITVTRDKNNLKYYTNGKLTDTKSVNSKTANYGNDCLCLFGSRAKFQYLQGYEGKLDNIRIYKRAISPFEISEIIKLKD